jgi:hypothetical protein
MTVMTLTGATAPVSVSSAASDPDGTLLGHRNGLANLCVSYREECALIHHGGSGMSGQSTRLLGPRTRSSLGNLTADFNVLALAACLALVVYGLILVAAALLAFRGRAGVSASLSWTRRPSALRPKQPRRHRGRNRRNRQRRRPPSRPALRLPRVSWTALGTPLPCAATAHPPRRS